MAAKRIRPKVVLSPEIGVQLGDTCPHCDGRGRQPYKANGWRIVRKYQSDTVTDNKLYPTLLAAVRQLQAEQTDPSCMIEVISPEGKIFFARRTTCRV